MMQNTDDIIRIYKLKFEKNADAARRRQVAREIRQALYPGRLRRFFLRQVSNRSEARRIAQQFHAESAQRIRD